MTGMTMQEATAMGGKMQELLKRQRLYFQELRKLSETQRMLIKAQQSEELLSVLGRRQKLVAAIGEIHQESAPSREKWPDFKDLLPNELRGAIGVLLEELQQMLNEIIEQDQQDCQDLSASKQQVASELQQTGRQRTAGSHYGTAQQRAYGQTAGGGNIQFTG